jgi:hypothetical protein
MKWCFHLAVWIDSYKNHLAKSFPNDARPSRYLICSDMAPSRFARTSASSATNIWHFPSFPFFHLCWLQITRNTNRKPYTLHKYASVGICLRHNTCYMFEHILRTYCCVSASFSGAATHPLLPPLFFPLCPVLVLSSMLT